MITKEEISLCKQVAERHRKKIERGDWYVNYDGTINLKGYHGKSYRDEESMLLWTISDCLEFLRENYKKVSYAWRMIIAGCMMNVLLGQKTIKDLHIACLKAVLAVLEEKK